MFSNMDFGGITKKLLLNLLVKVLGEFVELDENNLSVAIISGQVCLHNLKLRTENIFKKFNFMIFHGSLKTLEITIPWNLVGSAWKIKLEGILIDVGPPAPTQSKKGSSPSSKDGPQHLFGTWNSSAALRELLQKALDEKMQKLKMIDEYLELSHGVLTSEGSGSSSTGGLLTGNTNSESYIQQLTSRIIDNIEISLMNIHVRYEDSLAIPGSCFAAGITLEAFNISTCDEYWRPAFINNTDNGSSAACVKKLATLQSLGIYWEVQSESIAHLPFEAWKNAMLDMIHTGIRPVSRSLNYILSPAGSGMYMKFTHFKRPVEGMPRFDIIAESNDMKFHIDNTQYQQLFHLLDKIKTNKTKQFHDPNSYQPPERPMAPLGIVSLVSTSVTAWQVYHRKRMIRRWWQYGKNLILLRNKYVRLMKRKKLAQLENQDIEHALTRKEINELCSIEERLPLDVLKRFRQYALVEFYRENKHLRPKPANEKEKSSGWFGWGGSSNNDNTGRAIGYDSPIDLLPLDEVVMKIDQMESEQSKKLFSSIKIQLSSSSTIILSTPASKLIECKGAVTISLQKSSKLITFGCFLTDVSIVDGMGISPFHPHLLSVKSDSSHSSSSSITPAKGGKPSSSRRPGEFKPTLSVLIENLKGKTKISVSALPVEIYLNKLCIQTLLGEFALPKKQINKLKKSVNVEKFDRETLETALLVGTKYSSQAFKQMMKSSASTTTLSTGSSIPSSPEHKQGDEVEIVLDIHAPKIIIPEDCTKDAGFLLLDCGLLNVKGFVCSDGTMSFSTSLKKINAGLPLHIHDLYSLEDLSLYLIKPFDLNIQMQSIDQSVADLTVAIDVSPQVRGEVDAIKLARLLKIVNGVGETFTPKKSLTSSSSVTTLPVSNSALSLVAENGTAPTTPLRGNKTHQSEKDDMDLLRDDLIIQPALEAYLEDDNNSDGFATPLRMSLVTPNEGSRRESTSDIVKSPNTTTPSIDQRDPNAISMRIAFTLPILALDLTYDYEQNQHIVFTIEGLNLDMINRTFDRKINFVMRDFSIEDSIRHESQRFVAWSPKDSDQLINVAILMIQSKRSPLYRYHALEMDVTFADLRLNVDVPTVLHLKPFFEVLLDKKGKPLSPPPPPPQSATGSKSTRKSLVPFSSPDAQMDPAEIPNGTKIDARMKKFIVDILRPSYIIGESGLMLDTAFSMRMVDMRLDMNLMDLMTTDLRLRTFEIVDIRNFSKDYIFKNLFCPTTSTKDAAPTISGQDHKMVILDMMDDVDMANEAVKNDGIIFGQLQADSPQDKEEDLLHLIFIQESKTHSLCNVMVSGITSFVAIDAILDFAVLASSNFFTITGLFASKDEETPPVSNSGGRSNNSGTVLNETNNTMNAVVTMVNSRLILLEDPAMNESRAIVGQCKLDVHYSKDTRITTPTSYAALIKGDTAPRVEVFESVHVTVSDNEVFVLKSMKSWNPLPILEPFDVEFHFKRHLINGDAILTDVQAELESIEARLSFNDLLLAHSILSRRSLAQEDTQRLPTGGNNNSNSNSQPMSSSLKRASSLDFGGSAPAPSVIVRFGLTAMTVVVVNDFNATAIPVLRLLVGDTTFYAEGLINNVQGEGSSHMKIDYFHSPILTWEPLLETWRPSCRISVEPMATIVDVKSDHTVQLTFSGAMLETFLRSYTLFFHDNDRTTTKDGYFHNDDGAICHLKGSSSAAGSMSSSDIMLYNCLGDGIDVDILDSTSKQRLMELIDGDCSDLTSVLLADPSNKKSVWIMKSFQKLPTAVDIVFKGCLANSRQPLTFLPFNITKPKALTLQRIPNLPSSTVVTATDSSGTEVSMKSAHENSSSGGNQQFIMEPIEEEVYQNCRYDPISGKWRRPYFLGDPYEWTDGSGLVKKDANSVEIHSDRWEWTGKWEVDMDGVVGVEIDDDGWEYATSFSFFSMVSPRRTFQALDGVRRRRWTRTRVPKLPLEIQQNRPLTVVWDVQTLKSGARKVLIRSGFQIVNDLDLDVWICLQHPIWKDEKVLGPVRAGETFNVPLMESFAAQIKFRPVMGNLSYDDARAGREREGQDGDYEWSSFYQCNLHSYDFKIVKDVSCLYKPFTREGGSASAHSHYPIHFRAWTIRDNKMLTLRLVPYLVIRNKLLCNTNYRCSGFANLSGVVNPATAGSVELPEPIFQEVTESHAIQPGRASKLRYISFVMGLHQKTEPTIAFQLGTFDWSVDYKISRSQGSNQLVALELKKVEDPSEVLPIVMQIKLNSFYSIEVDVFFKVAMIDRTGLNLCVKSLRASGAGTGALSAASVTTRRGGRVELVRQFNTQGDDVFHPSAPWNNYSTKKKEISTKKYSPLKAPSSDNVSSKALATPPLGMKTIPSYDIENLRISSIHVYEVSRCDIGTNVYSDAKFRWSHLPHCLRGQTGIKLPLSDRYCRTSNYLTFTLRQAALIFVLIDNKCHSLPWLHSEGYVKTPEIAVAKRVSSGHLLEMNYNIYGKFFESGKTVTCGGSWDRSSSFMYSVIIVTANEVNRLQTIQDEHDQRERLTGNMNYSSSIALALFHQIMHNKEFSLDLAGLCWTECCKNIMAFYSTDNLISVSTAEAARLGSAGSNVNGANAANRLANEDAWSEEISIDTRTNSSTKGSFTIDCARNDICYQLSYTLENLPGLYQHTQIVTFMPRFVILNCIGEDEMLYVAQKGSHRHTEFAPYQPEGWHVIDPKFGFEVVLRTSSTTWSLGAVCLDEIGSTVLYIPYSNQDHVSGGSNNNLSNRGLVLHVEVKIAEPTDNCSIIVVVWQETVESQGAMSINNDSDVPITIRQMNIELDHDLGEKEYLYELTVPPGKHFPFGWTDPDCGTDILVAVGNNLQPASGKRIARLNFLKHEQRMRLPFVHSSGQSGLSSSTSGTTLNAMGTNSGGTGTTSSYYDEVILNITTSDAGHVLHVSKSPSKSSHLHLPINENQEHHLIIPDHPPHLAGSGSGGSSATGHGDPIDGDSSTTAGTTFQVIPLFGFNIFLSSLGVSLIVEKPRRRELFSLYIDRMEVFVKAKGAMKTLEFSIMDLQLDNYSETMIYPILLRSTKKDFHRSVNYEDEYETAGQRDGSNNSEGDHHDDASTSGIGGGVSAMSDVEKPFIQLSIVQDQPRDSKRPILKYVAFRILSLAVEVDSATIQLLFLDLLDDLKILTNNQILALNVPHRWLHDFNRDLLSPMMNRQSLIDIHYCKQLAQQNKMYIKNLIIHPMKITVTLFQTTFQRPGHQHTETLQSTMLNALMSLVGVEKLQLKLSSFEVEDAMESYDTLISLVTTKAVQDMRSQLAQIAGSLAMIGSPIGFARKVGSGVKAFFYEPYLGAIHGSHDFVSGLRKGTTRLISGVVTGAMDSAVAFVGTASKGISYLSGDIDYVRTRAMRRQQQIAHVRNQSHAMSHRAASEGGFNSGFGGLSASGNHGIYSGFKYGGESFVTGITAGVAGLVSKPIEGAAQGGVKGFFKGVGLGLLGAAVKPLVGLTEGLTSIAYGISSQVDPNSYKYQHVRPPRALEPVVISSGSAAAASAWLSLTSSSVTGHHGGHGDNDSSILIITALNLESAYAQDFVMKRALQNHYQDHFLYYLPLGEVKGEAVILSEVYLFWRRTKSLWGRVWPNISHCVYVGEGVGIMLYSGACQGNTELVVIPCKSKPLLKALYTALARNAHRMGNPSKVVSPELIDWNANTNTPCLPSSINSAFASSPRAKHFKPLPRSRSGSNTDSSPGATNTSGNSGIDYEALVREANKVGELDGYRFGSINGKSYGGGHGSGGGVVGTEQDVIHRAQDQIHRGCRYWRQLDETLWHLIYDWGLAHTNLASCRCCTTLIINHSDSPIQITRIQMMMGRQVVIMGSEATGYEAESRLIWSRGYVVVFVCAFPQSPLEVGHLKAKINSVAFTGLIASTQRETYCEAKSGFTIGFLEKSVSEWWSKYVVHIS